MYRWAKNDVQTGEHDCLANVGVPVSCICSAFSQATRQLVAFIQLNAISFLSVTIVCSVSHRPLFNIVSRVLISPFTALGT